VGVQWGQARVRETPRWMGIVAVVIISMDPDYPGMVVRRLAV